MVLKTSHYKTQNVQCKFCLCTVRSDLEFTGSRFWIVRLQRAIDQNKQSLQLKIKVFSLTTNLQKSFSSRTFLQRPNCSEGLLTSNEILNNIILY